MPAIVSDQGGTSKAYGINRAFKLQDAYLVTNHEWARREDEQTRNHVGQQVLQGESNRNTKDTHLNAKRAQDDIQLVQTCDETEEQKDEESYSF